MGPVVRRPISANLGLNFNLGFFFFSRIIFSPLKHPVIKLYTEIFNLTILFKRSYLNSNLALTLGYLYPALNNPAVGIPDIITTAYHNAA